MRRVVVTGGGASFSLDQTDRFVRASPTRLVGGQKFQCMQAGCGLRNNLIQTHYQTRFLLEYMHKQQHQGIGFFYKCTSSTTRRVNGTHSQHLGQRHDLEIRANHTHASAPTRSRT